MSEPSFDFVEIRLGALAGWWVRTEADRLELIKYARGLGNGFDMLVEERNAIRVCATDGEFDYLLRISGREQVLVENLPASIGMACVLPEGWYDDLEEGETRS